MESYKTDSQILKPQSAVLMKDNIQTHTRIAKIVRHHQPLNDSNKFAIELVELKKLPQHII